MMDYPELKKAYSKESARWQRLFFRIVLVQLSITVAIASLSLLLVSGLTMSWERICLYVIVFAFITGIFTQFYAHRSRIERRWYACRAVTESIKSLSWLFSMKAGEFALTDDHASKVFDSSLQKLVEQIESQGVLAPQISGAPRTIPSAMDRIRSSDWKQRESTYLTERLEDQRQWYTRRKESNSRRGRAVYYSLTGGQVFGVSLSLYFLAIGFGGNASVERASLSLIVTVLATLVAWTQARQYNELVEPYALAAMELGEIKSHYEKSPSERAFLLMVREAEFAISREHTSWLARRGTIAPTEVVEQL